MKIRAVLASATLALTLAVVATAPSAAAATRTQGGYWMLAADGHVYGFGGAADLGSPSSWDGRVKITPTATGEGYWVLDSLGGIHAFGDAKTFGSVPFLGFGSLSERYTTMAATPSGRGYWLFTNQGRVMRFGDATHYGDLSGITLNGPILDAVATPTGRGYYMVGSDGGVFPFGDAKFAGSTGNIRLNKPVMSLAPDPDGFGYWLVASDGGIFGFNAPFYGSAGGLNLNKPITGMVASPTGRGYLMVGADGGIFSYGDVPFYGSLGGNPPPFPVVSVGAIAGPAPAPVTGWNTVFGMSGSSNTDTAQFDLNTNPARLDWTCQASGGSYNGGCHFRVINAKTGDWLESFSADGGSGTKFLHPEEAGFYYVEVLEFNTGITSWQLGISQEVCMSNCQFYGLNR